MWPQIALRSALVRHVLQFSSSLSSPFPHSPSPEHCETHATRALLYNSDKGIQPPVFLFELGGSGRLSLWVRYVTLHTF